MYQALRMAGNLTAWIVYAAVAIAALPAIVLGLSPYGWPLLPFVGVLLLGVQRRVQRRRATVLLGYVEQALWLNLPLQPMLEAAAASESRRIRTRLSALADRLEMGEPLWRGLREAAPELPERTIAILERAECLGRLPEAVSRLVEEGRTRGRREASRGGIPLSYPFAVAWIALLAMLFYFILIAPHFIEIFEDYDATLPPVTQSFLAFGRWLWFGGNAMPGIAVVAVGLLLVAMVWTAWQAGFGRQLVRPAAWWLPIFGRLERDRGYGDVCFVLEESVAAGAPMHAALREAMSLDVNPVLRGRLERWQLRVESGEPLAAAARASRLPPLVSGMLEVGQTSGTLPAAVAFLRRFYDGRHATAAALAQAAAGPAVLLVVGGLVAWIVLAVFLPLVTLINGANVWAQGWTP